MRTHGGSLIEERLILEPDHCQVDARADRLDPRGQLVARLIALDKELAGVEHNVCIGEDALAVDDHSCGGGVLRAVLGPGMNQVRVPHCRADLHDRFADLALLGVALGQILRLRDRSLRTGATRSQPLQTVPAAALVGPEIIRKMFITWLTRWWFCVKM